MVKAIYNIEPIYDVYPEAGICQTFITFQGKTYSGVAQLAPEDKDFFSEKVGLNIALSRTRIKILKDKLQEAKQIEKARTQMYREATGYGLRETNAIDPMCVFMGEVIKSRRRVYNLKAALKKEQTYLRKYLENQDKMVERVKRIRERDKKE